MPTRYGMVTDIRNMPSLAELAAASIVPLYGANDPGGYAAVQAAMQAAQNNAGLWIPSDNRGVQDYVDWVKSWLSAFPDSKHVDLNIETAGKGYPGSPGWDYTDQVLQQLEPYLQGREWSVSPMGMQNDFNYGAVVSRGGKIWPQAYQGDMTQLDPVGIVEWVRKNNVPMDSIMPLLGSPSSSWGNLYGIDLPGWRGHLGMMPTQVAPDQRQLASTSASQESARTTGPNQLPVFNPASRGTRFIATTPVPPIVTPRDFLRL